MKYKWYIKIVSLLLFFNYSINEAFSQSISHEVAITAYIYNFIKNIHWSDENSFDEFKLLIYDNDDTDYKEFYSLEKLKKIRDKKINIIISTSSENISDAQLIFVPKKNESSYIKIFDQVEGKNCLLISDRYKDERLIMINFVLTKEGNLLFEINRVNIINQKLQTTPELVLLGGSEVDVLSLFQEGQLSLRRMQKYSSELESNIEKMRNGLVSLEESIQIKNNEVKKSKDSIIIASYLIAQQGQKIKDQNLLLDKQLGNIKRQDLQLADKKRFFELQRNELEQQKLSLKKGDKKLSEQEKLIKDSDLKLLEQSEKMKNQGVTISRQRSILYSLLIFVLFIVLLIIQLFLNNKQKRKINKDLEERVSARTKELQILNNKLKTELDEKDIVEKKLRTFNEAVQQSNSSIIFTDISGNIEYCNNHFKTEIENTLEFKSKEDLFIFREGHINESIFNEAKYLIKNNNIWKKVYELHSKDGEKIWIENVIFPIFNKSGLISNYVLVFENTTEKKNIFNELLIAKVKAEESDRLKTTFLHNISHEIRTPMNAIIGFSDFLRDPGLSAEKRNLYINIISQSSNQLLAIITDILNTASLESGNEKIIQSTINLNSIFRLLYDQFSQKCTFKNLILNYKTGLPDNKSQIICDELKLTTILTNLINNAIKFTEKGTIEFGYSLKNGELEFYVEDTGIGIPKNMQTLIFDRFTQVETQNIVKTGGSGLGLSIAKEYVALMGGSISLVSEPEMGSVFSFTLPYQKPEKESFSGTNKDLIQKIHQLNEKNDKIILIAEDDEFNYKLLEEILKEYNFKIIRASNGIEAVEYCEKKKPAIVLMDLKMPEMDGYEATKRIMNIHPDLPVIAQSAYNTDADRKKAMDSGCFGFISKPINRKELLTLISEKI
jgi:PAS domain S-box-containing protein